MYQAPLCRWPHFCAPILLCRGYEASPLCHSKQCKPNASDCSRGRNRPAKLTVAGPTGRREARTTGGYRPRQVLRAAVRGRQVDLQDEISTDLVCPRGMSRCGSPNDREGTIIIVGGLPYLLAWIGGHGTSGVVANVSVFDEVKRDFLNSASECELSLVFVCRVDRRDRVAADFKGLQPMAELRPRESALAGRLAVDE